MRFYIGKKMNDDSKTGEIINSLARFGDSDKIL